MTDDLAGFLRARLDEDQEIARDVQDGSPPWDGQWISDGPHALRTRNGHVLAFSTRTTDGRDLPLDLKPGLVEHWARHDPARVLAEVNAKRRILDRYTSAVADSAEDADGYYDETRFEDARQLYPVLRLLALPYADHLDYRPEWAPDA
jgi:hypothetical protein